MLCLALTALSFNLERRSRTECFFFRLINFMITRSLRFIRCTAWISLEVTSAVGAISFRRFSTFFSRPSPSSNDSGTPWSSSVSLRAYCELLMLFFSTVDNCLSRLWLMAWEISNCCCSFVRMPETGSNKYYFSSLKELLTSLAYVIKFIRVILSISWSSKTFPAMIEEIFTDN